MTLTICITLLTLTAVAKAADPPKGAVIAREITATWICQDKIPVDRTPAKPSPWALKGHNPTKILATWQRRHNRCLATLHERARQWNWQAWLPSNWVAVARCETGINWGHSNSSYVSAFGIQRGSHNGAYDSDAHKVGMPGWDEVAGGRPSPWQQYQTALSHYRSFGDGWGCPGP